ncbi:hypothetical protein ACOSQ3_014484 [Xanthoceras sorbifolium]
MIKDWLWLLFLARWLLVFQLIKPEHWPFFQVYVGLFPLLVESDFKVVMDLINGRGSSRSTLSLIVSRILNSSSSGQIIYFSHVPHVSYVAAHALSRLALSLDNGVVCLEEVPVSLLSILQADCQEVLYSFGG